MKKILKCLNHCHNLYWVNMQQSVYSWDSIVQCIHRAELCTFLMMWNWNMTRQISLKLAAGTNGWSFHIPEIGQFRSTHPSKQNMNGLMDTICMDVSRYDLFSKYNTPHEWVRMNVRTYRNICITSPIAKEVVPLKINGN